MRMLRRANRPATIGLEPCLASLLGVLFALPVGAHAEDRPIDGKVLKIAQTATGARLVFVSRDPSLLFPPIGSADDPATGTPGGAVVEIFTETEPAQTLSAPAGLGNPGWKVKSGANGSYLYRSATPSVRKIVLREDKLLKVLSDDAGLALTAPLGGVAIRITTGSLRNCAVFTAATIRRDEAGRFLARDSSGSALSDCSDLSLLAALELDCDSKGDYPTCGGPCPEGASCQAGPGDTCACVAPPQPCGDTEPSCNGTCPSGEECVGILDGPPLGSSCVCTPIGVTPCGAVDPEMCDNGVGACPPDETCQFFRVDPGLFICACFDPNQSCGNGPGYCPPDSQCQPVPPGNGQYTCVPTFCGGTYPACGGACDAGRNCVPVDVGGAGFCLCAAPENECEGLMCGGFSCPPGEVCTPDLGTTACTCEPL
jgi:hypothetical protein